jgi:hypothetical protein
VLEHADLGRPGLVSEGGSEELEREGQKGRGRGAALFTYVHGR